MVKYASIVPLIGGETIAMQNVFGTKPEYILSYTDFEANDSQLLNYYSNSVPYYKLDVGGLAPHSVDIVNTVCPCAGLSSLSPSSNADSSTNDWMVKSAEYVLESIQPTVFWAIGIEAADVQDAPHQREVRIGLRLHHRFKIELEIGLAAECGTIAQ